MLPLGSHPSAALTYGAVQPLGEYHRSELHDQTPFWDDVAEAVDPVKESTVVDRLTLRRRAFTANKRAKE